MYLKEIHSEDLNTFHPVEDVYKFRAFLSIKEVFVGQLRD
jgi:hypothetical protein